MQFQEIYLDALQEVRAMVAAPREDREQILVDQMKRAIHIGT